MFNKLRDKNISDKEKMTVLNKLMKEVDARASYGYYRNAKLQYVISLIKAIIDTVNSPNPSRVQLESYYKKLETEYKKYLYVFILEGRDGYAKDIVRSHLEKQEYMIADDKVDGFPYYITLSFGDELSYSKNNIPVESYIDCVYLKNIHYRINMKRYAQLADSDVKGIMTGLSYVYYAVKPELLTDKIAMLATTSQDLFYDYEMLKIAYRDHGDTLKYVVAGLCPYTMRYDLSQSKGVNNRTPQYHQATGTIHNYKPDISDTLTQIENAIIDVWGYDFVDEIYYQYFYPSLTMETGISTAQWIYSEEYIADAWKHDIYSKTHKDYPDTLRENREILANYVRFCEEHNLKLFFLMPPFSNYYKKTWNSDYVEELWDIIKEIGGETDYTILDFSDEEWPDFYFGDYAHLNEIGAIRFTSIFDDVIQSELMN